WYYRARIYSPTLGRFMQTDPIGYGDGLNLYAYVHNDPVNLTDPTGLQCSYQNWTMHIYDAQGHDLGPDPVNPESGVIFYGDCFNGTGSPGGIRPRSFGGGGSGAVGDTIVVTGQRPQRTQSPTPCQRAFLKSQLASRGMPTGQIDSLRFVSGLDGNANALSRQAFNGGAAAVTQGSTVYVQPRFFDRVANFRSATGFEEAYHSAQFAADGRFYTTYGILSFGGLLSTGDSYNGNLYEAFAKGAAML